MNPNHYLAVAIRLPAHASPAVAARRGRRQDAGQQQHDRPRRRRARPHGCARCRSASSGSRRACSTARCCFGGEESAGASFLRRDGTRLDDRQGRPDPGPARGRDHRAHRQGPRRALPRADGASSARRTTRASTRRRRPSRRRGSRSCRPKRSRRRDAGRRADHGASSRARPATTRRSAGSRSSPANGWFAARPSGTENIYKIYAESFRDDRAPRRIVSEAQEIVNDA